MLKRKYAKPEVCSTGYMKNRKYAKREILTCTCARESVTYVCIVVARSFILTRDREAVVIMLAVCAVVLLLSFRTGNEGYTMNVIQFMYIK